MIYYIILHFAAEHIVDKAKFHLLGGRNQISLFHLCIKTKKVYFLTHFATEYIVDKAKFHLLGSQNQLQGVSKKKEAL